MKNSGTLTARTYLLLFGLAITVPLVLLAGALLFQSASAQRNQLEGRLLQVLNDLVSDIDRDLDRHITVLHTLATSQALASADWPTFYNEAKAGLQGRAYLVLVDPTGRQLVNTYVPYGQQPAMTGDPETVRRIVQMKAPVVSNLFESLVVKKPVFNVSIPILQGDQVRYVMSLGLLPDDLSALLKSQKLDTMWVTLIWDANGVILARSQENSHFVGTSLPQNMRELAQPAILRTTNLDGTDVLHATARSRVSGWGVGVNVAYSLITEPMRNSMLLWGAGGLLAITIALVLGTFFTRQITTPLSVAASAAAAFGRGEAFLLASSSLKEADAFLVTLKDAQQTRERLTEELKQSRHWLQTTLASIGDAVIATDQEGRITFFNGVAQSLTGWAEEEAIGRQLEEVFIIRNDETGARLENPVTKPLREGKIVGLPSHTELISKSGNHIPIDDSRAPIRDETGQVAGAVLVFRDMTHRKRAETALVRLNEDLKHFTVAATHDFREPLRMVTIHAQLLARMLKGQLAEEANGYLKQIVNGTERISRLIDGLLEFSRVGDAEKAESQTVNTEAAFEEALGNLTVAITEAKGVITHDPLPPVSADQTLVCQLFQNLLGNSVKYHRAEVPPKIHVSVQRDGNFYVFAVRDNGIGIGTEYQAQIFVPFKRLHGAEISGAGIGLATCKRIVERFNGRVWVESTPDEGSCFYFSLPAAEGAAHA